jgi:hypothetical protein
MELSWRAGRRMTSKTCCMGRQAQGMPSYMNIYVCKICMYVCMDTHTHIWLGPFSLKILFWLCMHVHKKRPTWRNEHEHGCSKPRQDAGGCTCVLPCSAIICVLSHIHSNMSPGTAHLIDATVEQSMRGIQHIYTHNEWNSRNHDWQVVFHYVAARCWDSRRPTHMLLARRPFQQTSRL